MENVNLLAGYSKIVIFGAGTMGRIIKNYASHKEVCVSNFVDNNIEIHGKFIDGVRISSIDNLCLNNVDAIVVSIEGKHDQELIKELTALYPKVKIISWKELVAG